MYLYVVFDGKNSQQSSSCFYGTSWIKIVLIAFLAIKSTAWKNNFVDWISSKHHFSFEGSIRSAMVENWKCKWMMEMKVTRDEQVWLMKLLSINGWTHWWIDCNCISFIFLQKSSCCIEPGMHWMVHDVHKTHNLIMTLFFKLQLRMSEWNLKLLILSTHVSDVISFLFWLVALLKTVDWILIDLGPLKFQKP